MSRRSCIHLVLLAAVFSLGCSAGGRSPSVVVGTEGTGGGQSGGGSGLGGDPSFVLDAGLSKALSAHIERDHLAVSFVTLGCAGDCADVEAVATGGAAPYAFAWEDGSTNPARRVCPTSTTDYLVSVTDAGFNSVEFHRPPKTVTAALTASVLQCPQDGGSAEHPDASSPTPVAPVYWATWAVPSLGTPGTAQGTTSPPGGDVQVSFAGEVGLSSAATGTVTLSGVGQVYFRPPSTYQSLTVPNAPPETGMITIWNSSTLTQTITFSVPVRDPLIAVIGLDETWSFDAPPTVLSSGPNELPPNTLGAPPELKVSGNGLVGTVSNGVLEFTGTFTAIRFTVPLATPAAFTGFTVGIRGRG